MMRRLLTVAAATALLLGASAPHAREFVVAAAGDIACDGASADSAHEDLDDRGAGCAQQRTAALVARAHPDALLPLGDEQYDVGAYAAFQRGYAPSWGRFDAIAHPAVGNHEYGTPGAAGYFRYFGVRAGDAHTGYYSFDAGGWHFIALNGNCAAVGGCGRDSAQAQWLARDLAAHRGICTLAYWHQPRFSSGLHGSDTAYDAFWRELYAAHAALVLNGHDHLYERFAPQTPDGVASSDGIREFVVGTGGKSHYRFRATVANSQMRDDRDFGVLFLTLRDRAYAWRFETINGRTADRGDGRC